jgi:hypothetical protein
MGSQDLSASFQDGDVEVDRRERSARHLNIGGEAGGEVGRKGD